MDARGRHDTLLMLQDVDERRGEARARAVRARRQRQPRALALRRVDVRRPLRGRHRLRLGERRAARDVADVRRVGEDEDVPRGNEREAVAHFLVRQPVRLRVDLRAGIRGQPPPAAIAQIALAVAGVEDDEVVVLREVLAGLVQRDEDLRVRGVEEERDVEAVLVAQHRGRRLRIVLRGGDGREVLVATVADDEREEAAEVDAREVGRRRRRGQRFLNPRDLGTLRLRLAPLVVELLQQLVLALLVALELLLRRVELALQLLDLLLAQRELVRRFLERFVLVALDDGDVRRQPGRAAIERDRLRRIGGHAKAFFVQRGEAELRRAVAGVRGLLVPRRRALVVGLRAESALVQLSDVVLRLDVALLGLGQPNLQRRRVVAAVVDRVFAAADAAVDGGRAHRLARDRVRAAADALDLRREAAVDEDEVIGLERRRLGGWRRRVSRRGRRDAAGPAGEDAGAPSNQDPDAHQND